MGYNFMYSEFYTVYILSPRNTWFIDKYTVENISNSVFKLIFCIFTFKLNMYIICL
jgi:hypothetical protein